MYRRSYSEAIEEESVPRIPVQPISYGDAIHFMRLLKENPVPPKWVGELNTTYFIKQSSSIPTPTVVLQVTNELEERTIYNVIGTIYGRMEPDRQVILGNHRDAWVFGAADPNSGTAVLMEMARTLSVLRRNNWRPGRTMVLCSWDAKEFSIIGSTEWVEEKGRLLGANAVAYLNVDIAVSGVQTVSTLVPNPCCMSHCGVRLSWSSVLTLPSRLSMTSALTSPAAMKAAKLLMPRCTSKPQELLHTEHSRASRTDSHV